ncbi:MAG: NYN domain protein [Chloroflexi bacterium HGW-Chloroflexi-1]|nr:MAG: NYN domain protein [Chloroflexi bacterium HGW-Chloroflexi-1]
MRTNVYVDGFNLYYGCLRHTPFKWLDLAAFCYQVLPTLAIQRIRYFTAHVRAPVNDPGKPQRQQTYLRALRTIPGLTVHLGTFLSHPAIMPLAHPVPGGPQTAEIIRTDEKGSDVNLASYLLVDGYEGDYDIAVVVSNDSDLTTPIQLVRQKLGLKVGVVNPQMSKHVSWALKNAADFYRDVHRTSLVASQFPPTLRDLHGTITKPAGW